MILLKRPRKRDALVAINRFLMRVFEIKRAQLPTVSLYPDGEKSWSFWIFTRDTTSYAKAEWDYKDRKPFVAIEWYGTEWEPGVEVDE